MKVLNEGNVLPERKESQIEDCWVNRPATCCNPCCKAVYLLEKEDESLIVLQFNCAMKAMITYCHCPNPNCGGSLSYIDRR